MSIRAQVTISNPQPLGGRVAVEIVARNPGTPGTFTTFWMEPEDAEYQLLAAAIDRFEAVAVARLENQVMRKANEDKEIHR